jgi:RNA-dependent RNA polymerase
VRLTSNTVIVFDVHTPPIFEEKNFNDRPREGITRRRTKDRDRVPALDAAHARVAPYTPHMRVVLFSRDDLEMFERLCEVAQCEPRPLRVRSIDAGKGLAFFAQKYLHGFAHWLRDMEWTDAFQLEALLRNGALNTLELLDLQAPIEAARTRFGALSSQVLRIFGLELGLRAPGVSAAACFARVCAERVDGLAPVALKPGWFACHHVTFTPTRALLEGPYVSHSNRVIRRYQKAHAPSLLDRFVRVDFRDEDRLSFRWDRNVDGVFFLQERVGRILKEGFELGGRHFEFLAYSNSALRSHAVWFVSPFHDPDEGYVNADRLRRSIGDFGDLYNTPSKLAARIAQAFTATDPSVTLLRHQWEEMDDIKTTMKNGEMSCHTDGVGTISSELRDMIWDMLCGVTHNFRKDKVKPSAVRAPSVGFEYLPDMSGSSSKFASWGTRVSWSWTSGLRACVCGSARLSANSKYIESSRPRSRSPRHLTFPTQYI